MFFSQHSNIFNWTVHISGSGGVFFIYLGGDNVQKNIFKIIVCKIYYHIHKEVIYLVYAVQMYKEPK